jgi:hypothetical protein
VRHAANLPRHLYVQADCRAISDGQTGGTIDAVWFGLLCVPHRAWCCTVMLKNGAIYRNLPLAALSLRDDAGEWTTADSQRWDCFGWDFSVIEYDYLRELDCRVWIASRGRWLNGSYLFTAEPYGDGYSLEPAQTKSFHFVELENGRIGAYPGNNILWEEVSFTGKATVRPDWLRVQTQTHHAEQSGWDSVVGEETA